MDFSRLGIERRQPMMRTLREDQVYEQAKDVAMVGVERALHDVLSRKRRSAVVEEMCCLIDIYSALVVALQLKNTQV